MSQKTALLFTCVLSLVGAATVQAQTKTLPGEHTTITATVEAIEQASRTWTLRGPKGELHTAKVPPDVKRFSEIKVGDTVTATYYDNIVLRVKSPGEPDVDTLTGALTPGSGGKPSGTAASQQTITATIDAIDMSVPSISFKGPRGWSYSSRVQDKKALQQVKVGDRVDITWTEAVVVSVEPPKK
jgi:hypothetical protein